MDSFLGGCTLTATNEGNRDRVARQFKLLKHSVSLPLNSAAKSGKKGTGAMRERIFAVLTALFDMWGDSHVERNFPSEGTIARFFRRSSAQSNNCTLNVIVINKEKFRVRSWGKFQNITRENLVERNG